MKIRIDIAVELKILEDNKLILALPMEQGYPIIPMRGSVFGEAKFCEQHPHLCSSFGGIYVKSGMGNSSCMDHSHCQGL